MDETLTGAAQFPDDRLWIESLDMDAQGIAHREDGIVVFVEGALPFEQVSVNTYRKKSSFHKATVTAIHHQSSQRVLPGCPHFGLHAGACGGCKMQHLDAAAQVASKQRVLEDNLWHLAKVRPENLLRPIHGPTWGYRYRARLSVRYVRKKDAVLIGFHERKSSFVADMRECRVLHPFVSSLLMPLRELFMGMQARESCPQIELAVGDDAGLHVVALVLRHLEPLSGSDKDALRSFAACHSSRAPGQSRQLQWWLQPKGPETVALLDDDGTQLAYCLPEFGLRMPFNPTDFTQVNPQVNAVLVGYALRLLAARRDERVIDWFCGLGNFTLPLATQAGQVVGVEGSELLVARARANASTNQAAASASTKFARTEFVTRNLFDMTAEALLADGVAQRWMLDPPREGALALVKALAKLHQAAQPDRRAVAPGSAGRSEDAPAPDLGTWSPPTRIVYVSCNPATLARDAGMLVHEAGYRCSAAGVVNMFPHTAHVESVVVFDRVF